jgi:hypothetical protein
MATTLTVNNAKVFAQTLIKNQRLWVNNQEPALTIANIVLQRILGSPFVWRFNRAGASIAISSGGGTDYTVSLPLLGRIETQWLVDASGTIYALKGAVELAKVSSSRRPQEVAPVYDDNAGNITFRFDTVPDKNYTAFFDYQQKAPLLTGTARAFGPVPDEFGYVFNTGFLAWASLLVNDARFPIWEKWFIGALLGAQDGLDEQAKAIMLGQWLAATRSMTRSDASGKMGSAGLGT